MVATILVGMLCAHLLCFSVMFLLISRRLQGNRMGMDVFALGDLLLGSAYVLQLVEGEPAWSVMSVVNHTLTLAAPIAYWLGAMRFFGAARSSVAPVDRVFSGLRHGAMAGALERRACGTLRDARSNVGSALLRHDTERHLWHTHFCQGLLRGNDFLCFCDWRHLCAQCIEILENYGRRPGSTAHGKPLSDGFLHLHVHPGDRAASLHCLAGVAAPDG